MKAKKIYLLPERINESRNVKRNSSLRAFLIAGMLLLTMPSMAQYFNVVATSGTVPVGGVNVTVTSVNGDVTSACGLLGPYREGNGAPGSYTWSFSAPMAAVRVHIDGINVGDDISFMVNGSPYLLSSSEVTPLASSCFGGLTAVAVGGNLVSNGSTISGATVDIYNGGLGINSITIASLGAGGGVVSDFYFEPVLDFTPVFVSGATQVLSVCQDAPATDFSGQMSVNDTDPGQTETWTVYNAPTHGTLNGFPVSMPSTGGVVTISGVTYTPDAGYNGPDAFSIIVSDGTYYDTTMVNVTVKPTPDVTVPSSQAVCNNGLTNAAMFTGSVSGTTFNWVNNAPSIGLAASGSGDILSFMATNPTSVPVVATVTVTPTALGCVGTAKLFSITVNPTPNVVVPGNQAVCNGNNTPLASFSSNVAGATYTWVNNNTSIGLASTGTGNILPFTATNSGTAPIKGIITVTPSANTCAGPSQSYTVTVNPTPMLSSTLTPTEVCYASLFNYVPASATSGATFAWSRAVQTGISNSANSSTGSISETLINTTTLPVPVKYVYTTSANTCSYTQTVTVVMNPQLLLTSTLTPAAICDNTVFSYIPTGGPSGTTYQWNRNAVAGISNPATTNSFNPLETLHNTTALPVVVTYNYSIIYHACSNTQNVTVTVKPTPTLISTLTPAAVCDSVPFKYGSQSATPGTTFAWSRAAVTGISNPMASGIDTIRDTLVNTTTHPVSAVYMVTSTANSCSGVQYVTLSVNPLPKLSSSVTPPGICNKTSFDYLPSSATVGTSFAWSRALTIGITNPAAHDTGAIHEILINNTDNPITVNYVDTLTINGCINTQQVSVLVNPTPRLSSTHTPPAICDSAFFNYTPTSLTTGASFTWTRPYVLGIDVIAGTGTNDPNEPLINTTNFNVNVVYQYKVTINGCSYFPDTVTVTVRPTPYLSSPLTATVCSNAPFTYAPESHTSGVGFTWKRGKVSGINPATGSGGTSANINEVLTDTATFPINAVYTYTLTITGTSCIHKENVVVTVNPAPVTPIITISPKGDLCTGTHYQNFGAAVAAPAGVNYLWSVVNANLMATKGQNALVSFNNPGTAKVILSTNMMATSCKNVDTLSYTVGSSISDNPNVIYYNGQFICLQNNVSSYQWGYDDAITLDSNLIAGEVNQTYFNGNPDFQYKYYWLMTTHNGCSQKSYYNVPTGITNVNADASSIKVYPNPANAVVNVEINTTIDGNIDVEVLNLLGQKVSNTQAVDHKAAIGVSGLANGCYMVNCYREGVKIASAKFIKN